MTQDEIIKMARVWLTEFGIQELRRGAEVEIEIDELEAFAKLVAAKEREACAKIADRHSTCKNDTPDVIAVAIRARGKE